MRRYYSRGILVVVLVAIMLVATASTSIAYAAAPKTIYFTDSSNNIVRADYEAASDAYDAGDLSMWNALKTNLLTSLRAGLPIIVETTDLKLVDWTKAAMDGLSFSEAQTNPAYNNATAVLPTKELKPDGSVGEVGSQGDIFEVIGIE